MFYYGILPFTIIFISIGNYKYNMEEFYENSSGRNWSKGTRHMSGCVKDDELYSIMSNQNPGIARISQFKISSENDFQP